MLSLPEELSVTALHQRYLHILNAIPDMVYWIDKNCMLLGGNRQFIQLLGINQPDQLIGDPYSLMAKFTSWPKERIEQFRLDDMNAVFSGEPQYDIQEEPVLSRQQVPIYFRSRRVPLLNANQEVEGLIVVLTDITAYQAFNKPYDEALQSTHDDLDDARLQPKPRILMVEDSFIAQKVEEAMLLSLNCQVDIADTGERALELFQPGKYNLVLMDIGLQDTSGYLVAKKIRQVENQHQTSVQVPIIALTSYQADVVKYDCKEYFMDGVLTKPISKDQAQQIIQHFIYQKKVPVKGLRASMQIA